MGIMVQRRSLQMAMPGRVRETTACVCATEENSLVEAYV